MRGDVLAATTVVLTMLPRSKITLDPHDRDRMKDQTSGCYGS